MKILAYVKLQNHFHRSYTNMKIQTKYPTNEIANIILKYPHKDIIKVFNLIDEYEQQNRNYISQLESIIKEREYNA